MDLSSDSDEPSSLQTQTSANILGDVFSLNYYLCGTDNISSHE